MGMSSFTRLLGPTALTTTLTTNLYNPAAGVYAVIKAIHVCNKTAGIVNFTLYLGLTGGTLAGTEEWFQYPVPADGVYDWYGMLEMGASDFLTGGASANTSLNLTLQGEQYLLPAT